MITEIYNSHLIYLSFLALFPNRKFLENLSSSRMSVCSSRKIQKKSCPQNTKNTNLKRYMHSSVHSRIIYNCQDTEATHVSINRWTKEMQYTHTCIIHTMEYYSVIKKNKCAISSNMDRLKGHYTKWNKPGRERQILYDIAYMWNLKNTTNQGM